MVLLGKGMPSWSLGFPVVTIVPDWLSHWKPRRPRPIKRPLRASSGLDWLLTDSRMLIGAQAGGGGERPKGLED